MTSFTAPLRTQIAMGINMIVFLIGLILWFVWRSENDNTGILKADSSFEGIFGFYGFVVCYSFSSETVHLIFAIFLVERYKWKHQHTSWAIHGSLYCILYLIGASLLVSKLDDMKDLEKIANKDLYTLELYEAAVAFGYISVITSIVQVILNVKDFKESRHCSSSSAKDCNN